jgi:hypothetical protein
MEFNRIKVFFCKNLYRYTCNNQKKNQTAKFELSFKLVLSAHVYIFPFDRSWRNTRTQVDQAIVLSVFDGKILLISILIFLESILPTFQRFESYKSHVRFHQGALY